MIGYPSGGTGRMPAQDRSSLTFASAGIRRTAQSRISRVPSTVVSVSVKPFSRVAPSTIVPDGVCLMLCTYVRSSGGMRSVTNICPREASTGIRSPILFGQRAAPRARRC